MKVLYLKVVFFLFYFEAVSFVFEFLGVPIDFQFDLFDFGHLK